MDDDLRPGDSPDWARLRRDVCERIDYLAAAWAHTAQSPEVHGAMVRDLYLPTVRLLAEFCECVEIDEIDEAVEIDGAAPVDTGEAGDTVAVLTELARVDWTDAPAEALRAARAIMAATDGMARVPVGAGLLRALAGFYGRLALDAGDPPEIAAQAVRWTMEIAAQLAAQLVRDAQAPGDDAA